MSVSSSIVTPSACSVRASPSTVASTPDRNRSVSQRSCSRRSGSHIIIVAAGSDVHAMVVPSTSNGPNAVLHPAQTDMVSSSNPTSMVVPSTSSAPSTEVEAYDRPSSAATSTVVVD